MSTTPSRDGIGQRWDGAAIRAGAVICLVIAVPVTLLASFVDSDSGAVNATLFFAAMVGFIIGGGCAAWVERVGTPVSHAVVTAGGSYLAAQAVFVIVRLIGGRSVNWYSVFFTLGLVLLAGLAGGLLGARLRAKGITPSSTTGRP